MLNHAITFIKSLNKNTIAKVQRSRLGQAFDARLEERVMLSAVTGETKPATEAELPEEVEATKNVETAQPAGEQAVAGQPGAEQADVVQPAASQPAASQPVAEQPEAVQPAAVQYVDERRANDTLASEQPAADQSVAGKSIVEQPVAEEPAVEPLVALRTSDESSDGATENVALTSADATDADLTAVDSVGGVMLDNEATSMNSMIGSAIVPSDQLEASGEMTSQSLIGGAGAAITPTSNDDKALATDEELGIAEKQSYDDAARRVRAAYQSRAISLFENSNPDKPAALSYAERQANAQRLNEELELELAALGGSYGIVPTQENGQAIEVGFEGSGQTGYEGASIFIDNQFYGVFAVEKGQDADSSRKYAVSYRGENAPKNVQVAFINDYWVPMVVDNNLKVDTITVGDQAFDTRSQEVLSTATWDEAQRDNVAGYGIGPWLTTDGVFEVALGSPESPVAGGSVAGGSVAGGSMLAEQFAQPGDGNITGLEGWQRDRFHDRADAGLASGELSPTGTGEFQSMLTSPLVEMQALTGLASLPAVPDSAFSSGLGVGDPLTSSENLELADWLLQQERIAPFPAQSLAFDARSLGGFAIPVRDGEGNQEAATELEFANFDYQELMDFAPVDSISNDPRLAAQVAMGFNPTQLPLLASRAIDTSSSSESALAEGAVDARGLGAVLSLGNPSDAEPTGVRARFDQGYLGITGDDSDNRIVLERSGNGYRVMSNAGVVPILSGSRYSQSTSGPLTAIAVDAKGGNDRIDLSAASEGIYTFVSGGDGRDSIEGGAGIDYLYGGNGNDFIVGNGGDDHFFGNDGDDYIFGGEGNDRIDGGAGNDFLAGGIGDDYVAGGAGDDKLWGGEGRDQLLGGNGNDWLFGDGGSDQLYGGDGDDQIFANIVDETIDGENGKDTYNIIPDSNSNTEPRFIARDVDQEWIQSDLKIIDNAINTLREKTGNNVLVAPNDKPFVFEYRDPVAGGQRTWSTRGRVNDAENLIFRRTSQINETVVLHEIGHFWDQANTSNVDYNNAINAVLATGGWIRNPSVEEQVGRVPSGSSGWWRYDDESLFVNEYSMRNSREFFAVGFMTYFTGASVQGVSQTVPSDVRLALDNFFDVIAGSETALRRDRRSRK